MSIHKEFKLVDEAAKNIGRCIVWSATPWPGVRAECRAIVRDVKPKHILVGRESRAGQRWMRARTFVNARFEDACFYEKTKVKKELLPVAKVLQKAVSHARGRWKAGDYVVMMGKATAGVFSEYAEALACSKELVEAKKAREKEH